MEDENLSELNRKDIKLDLNLNLRGYKQESRILSPLVEINSFLM